MSDAWLSSTNNSDKRAIREVQMALGLHPDGQYGRSLSRTISEFQATNKLTVDGMVGPITWAALQGAPAEKPKKKTPAKKKAAASKETEAKAPAKKKAPAKRRLLLNSKNRSRRSGSAIESVDDFYRQIFCTTGWFSISSSKRLPS